MITHSIVSVNGADLHVARAGHGMPLVLLHGWPEFWLTWEPVMARLSDRFELIAPDLRGFGSSDKPAGTFGPADQATDLIAIMDALGLKKAGFVAHDIGGAIAQAVARKTPERVAGLFFFDFIYPGIGPRFAAPQRLEHVWYTFFHQSDLAPSLIGATPDTIRLYITHFLTHWAHRKHAFDDVLEAFFENFQVPGNLEGGFAHYRAVAAERKAAMAGHAALPAPIHVPTCVRWAEHDPLFDYAWTDRLPEFFTDLDLEPFPDVGHFPHRENPERAAKEIAGFFGQPRFAGWAN
jgi:pimeloyl-ACP methyl ester carboxylesterase